MRIRVIVHNVRGFRDGPERVRDLLRRLEPDIVLLNETGPRRRLRRLGRELGMEVAADPLSPLRRRVKDAVLVRPPWRLLDHRLHRFSGTDPMYPRGVHIARVGRAGRRLVVAATHLGLRPRERNASVRQLTDLLAAAEDPVVVGGDLNETADGRAVGWLAKRFWDAWAVAGEAPGETFPAADASSRIDFLFVSEGVRVEWASVPGEEDARRASDHLPVVADLELDVESSP